QFIIIACAVTLAGCGLEVTTMCMEEGGITYEMPAQTQIKPTPASREILRGIDGTSKTNTFGFTFFGDTITLHECEGKLTINDKEYGTVKAGDKVRIDKSGAVTINGTPRAPK
ncbi:MAG: hypothetical protein NTY53_14855, partial [Kiritimatiellaeota bacterium]|nr:hypothetical protein [Kiritimatiellota bacterium]